ncbi:MAG TPA: hypothetical protein VN366_04025 [Feifaniaceae bacterium]|nr:hypothetical protein [Feifaniaceae bacterium]
MWGKKSAALVLCVLMALMLLPNMALAEDEASPSSLVDPNASLIVSSVGPDGSVIRAPKGDIGDRIRITLPIFNRTKTRIRNILVTPQISATLDSFPFEVEAVNYTVSVEPMSAGQTRLVEYDFKIADKVTSGVKEVKFNVIYFNVSKYAYESTTLSAFVTVVKGYTPDKTDEDGNIIATTPKIILEGYTVTPLNTDDQQSGRLFAGEKFSIKLAMLNTSSEEAVKNIQLTLSSEGGVILPADNGSNTVYIDRIGPGETVEKTLTFQSAPDAEAKAHSLAAKFNYESSKTLKAYEATETITLPISQRMRVRIDDPMVYGDAMLEQSTPVSFSLYNMGKSTLYNCMVDVEGSGLKMEESFYGGNITSGNTMRADFNVIPSAAGQIEGKVVITYEDVYGEQTVVEKPLTLNVLENFMPDEGMMGPDGEVFNPGMEPEQPQGGISTGLIIAAAAVVLIGVIVLVVLLKRRRRRKQLEEI